MSSFYDKIVLYVNESVKELRKVLWPSWQETVRSTLLVIGISLGVALVLGGFDFIFSSLLRLLVAAR